MKKLKYFLYTAVLLFLFFYSCKPSENQGGRTEKCATKPAPIFSDTMSIVKNHLFEAKEENSTEEVILKNDVRIEVFQSGCKILRQEFRVTRKGDFIKMQDPFWISGSFQTLGQLSDSSPALKGLEAFANAIAQNLSQIKLGQPFSPDPTSSITIDKIVNEGEGTIIVVIQGEG